MAPLLDRFRAHLDRARLFPAPGTAVLAVSGGPDSVALLDLMRAVAPGRGLSLVVAHADHGIRADSRTVGQSVGALARRYGLPFEVAELELGPQATETAARRARYAWLAVVREAHAARYLDGASLGRPDRDDPAARATGKRARGARRDAGARPRGSRAAAAPVHPRGASGARRGVGPPVPRRPGEPRSAPPPVVGTGRAAAPARGASRKPGARRHPAAGPGGGRGSPRVGPCVGTRSAASASPRRCRLRRCSVRLVPL